MADDVYIGPLNHTVFAIPSNVERVVVGDDPLPTSCRKVELCEVHRAE